MKADIHERPFTDETVLKLEIFEGYLREWLPVFLYSEHSDDINICDLFAGQGYDSDGNPGSPIRIIEILSQFKEHIDSNDKNVNVIFNELDRNKFITLQECIDHACSDELQEVISKINIKYYNEEFSTLFPRLKNEIGNNPNLIFIDQYGIKEVTKNIFSILSEMKYTDFFFFISSSYFRRFIQEDCFRQRFPDIDIAEIRNSNFQDIHRIICSYYRRLIPKKSRLMLSHFSIKKNKNIYGLVYGSSLIV